jgi:hypothetical protein
MEPSPQRGSGPSCQRANILRTGVAVSRGERQGDRVAPRRYAADQIQACTRIIDTAATSGS